MTDIKILLIEDDPAMSMVISETLELEGFACVCAYDGIDGLNRFFNERFDVVVADIMMPKLDGLEMVSRMRQRDSVIPIIFLTAKSSVDDVVAGFETGANDYLRKPFSMRELIVRIRALYERANLLNPSQNARTNNIIRIGAYSFDPVSQILQFGIQTEELSARESELLALLAGSINNVVSSVEIMKSLWGDDNYYVANSLQVFITRLRQRLKDDPSIRIVNARGIGYKLVVDSLR